MSVFGVVKIVLLGDYATGKTTLKRNFMGLHLDEEYMSTLGVDLATHIHVDEDMEITFQIWDLGGQPEFQDIRLKQYVGSEGGLLVFDKGRTETFANLRNWLEEFNSSVKTKVPLIILGNKNDLLDDENNQRLDTEAELFLNENKDSFSNIDLVSYLSTCALTGENVDQAFLDLGRIIIRKKSKELKI
ncbi:MAG: Rab family GTPase [Candidatus Heimdallarchaeaceae archaeon]|jgi:Ras-related protein Rab-1A